MHVVGGMQARPLLKAHAAGPAWLFGVHIHGIVAGAQESFDFTRR
jgi:hypothetical protein